MEMRMKCEQMQVNTFHTQYQKLQHLPGSSASIICTLFLILLFYPGTITFRTSSHSFSRNSTLQLSTRNARLAAGDALPPSSAHGNNNNERRWRFICSRPGADTRHHRDGPCDCRPTPPSHFSAAILVRVPLSGSLRLKMRHRKTHPLSVCWFFHTC